MNVAEYWDDKYKTKGEIWGRFPSPHLDDLACFLRKNGVDNILEVGCGYGRDLAFLSKAGFDCTGVDPSSEAISMAREYFSSEGLGIALFLGDIFSVELDGLEFGAVSIVNILHLLDSEDRNKIFKKLPNLMKKGAYLSAVFLSTDDPVEYGRGKAAEKHAFKQPDGRVFYFFDEDMARSLLPKDTFNILELEKYNYTEKRTDGPPHHHTMWKLLAQTF